MKDILGTPYYVRRNAQSSPRPVGTCQDPRGHAWYTTDIKEGWASTLMKQLCAINGCKANRSVIVPTRRMPHDA